MGVKILYVMPYLNRIVVLVVSFGSVTRAGGRHSSRSEGRHRWSNPEQETQKMERRREVGAAWLCAGCHMLATEASDLLTVVKGL